MVRTERLELSHLAAPEPKSGVSTNSTTSAELSPKQDARHEPGVLGKDGVDDGNRTHDNRNHNPALYQLSYAHHIALHRLLNCRMAHPAGLEPATIRLEGGCSIQLSYGRSVIGTSVEAQIKSSGQRKSKNRFAPAF
jgi:hypothetical protein